jgi:hypothetical protein
MDAMVLGQVGKLGCMGTHKEFVCDERLVR